MTDPLAAPPCPYPLVPGAGGRLVWITGYPGTGKSTAAQIMARNHGQNHNNHSKIDFNDIYFLGYVYFEGDCFWGLKNPYIPVNVSNPTMAKVVELQAVSMYFTNVDGLILLLQCTYRSAKGPSLARVLRKGELWWRGGMNRNMTGGKMTWNLGPSTMMLSVMS